MNIDPKRTELNFTLAELVYHLGPDKVSLAFDNSPDHRKQKERWEALKKQGWTMGKTFVDHKTGFQAVVFEHKQSNRKIAAIAGWQADKFAFNDGAAVLFGLGKMQRGSTEYTRLVAYMADAAISDKQRIGFTGQSLGGLNAQLAAYDTAEALGKNSTAKVGLVAFAALGAKETIRYVQLREGKTGRENYEARLAKARHDYKEFTARIDGYSVYVESDQIAALGTHIVPTYRLKPTPEILSNKRGLVIGGHFIPEIRQVINEYGWASAILARPKRTTFHIAATGVMVSNEKLSNDIERDIRNHPSLKNGMANSPAAAAFALAGIMSKYGDRVQRQVLASLGITSVANALPEHILSTREARKWVNDRFRGLMDPEDFEPLKPGTPASPTPPIKKGEVAPDSNDGPTIVPASAPSPATQGTRPVNDPQRDGATPPIEPGNLSIDAAGAVEQATGIHPHLVPEGNKEQNRKIFHALGQLVSSAVNAGAMTTAQRAAVSPSLNGVAAGTAPQAAPRILQKALNNIPVAEERPEGSTSISGGGELPAKAPPSQDRRRCGTEDNQQADQRHRPKGHGRCTQSHREGRIAGSTGPSGHGRRTAKQRRRHIYERDTPGVRCRRAAARQSPGNKGTRWRPQLEKCIGDGAACAERRQSDYRRSDGALEGRRLLRSQVGRSARGADRCSGYGSDDTASLLAPVARRRGRKARQ